MATQTGDSRGFGSSCCLGVGFEPVQLSSEVNDGTERFVEVVSDDRRAVVQEVHVQLAEHQSVQLRASSDAQSLIELVGRFEVVQDPACVLVALAQSTTIIGEPSLDSYLLVTDGAQLGGDLSLGQSGSITSST